MKAIGAQSRAWRRSPVFRSALLIPFVFVLMSEALSEPSTSNGLEPRDEILKLGPWPTRWAADPTNSASGNSAAQVLGEYLFESPHLSGAAGVRCASCHEPWRAYIDGRATGFGVKSSGRNTLTLLNVRQNQVFGWDGATQHLWEESVRSILDESEMDSSVARVAQYVRSDRRVAQQYRQAFGGAPPADDGTVFLNVGRSLAAYIETLDSGRTPFDNYRDALERADPNGQKLYPSPARRGLLIFVGEGQCSTCHSGPNFSDGALHGSLIGPQVRGKTALNAAGSRLTGEPAPRIAAPAIENSSVEADPPMRENIRTPGLREVIRTAPYMHDGSVPDLCTALLPHALLGDARAGASRLPAELSIDQRRDLVSFLRTLSEEPKPPFVDLDALSCEDKTS